MNALAEIRSRFRTALGELTDDVPRYLGMIRPAQDSRFGDFQANCAMTLARELDRNPRDLASEIVAKLDVADLCLEPKVAGPGFINLTLRDDWIAATVNAAARDERLGAKKTTAPRRIVIDYSSPNIAKPMHVGHLRSTVIGDALYRILSFVGHQVLSDNHIGDWGTQFGMIIFGYRNFLDPSRFTEDPVGELARLYRLVNTISEYQESVRSLPELRATLNERERELADTGRNEDPADKSANKAVKRLRANIAERRNQIADAERRVRTVQEDPQLLACARAHPNIDDDAREQTAGLHAGEDEIRQLWERFLPQCLSALQSVYDRLEIKFDRTLGESYYQTMLGSVIEDLMESGIARESEGAICVFSEGNNAPFIVRKSDGAFTYATTDLATIRYRIEQFSADEILYVVDKRQSEHFSLLFDTAHRWGYTAAQYHHVSFGTILGDDSRPYRTRAGDTVGLESLLDESVQRAAAIVAENDDAKQEPELDDARRERIAQIVGIGGIKYVDLHHNRESDYRFSWDKMLATTGDTAAYAQYAFARVCGIFRRGGFDREEFRARDVSIHITHDAERGLALQLTRFPDALDDVLEDYRPNLLTAYLFETGNRFSTFFDRCPVLKEDDQQIRNSRLLLCDLTARVLHTGLQLLGIHTAERM